ncbi:MAG: DUF2764 family protein [Spirochaetaceae bacterium]|jgi:hypothetical protein|nr:DUF2764 family protein [Spirochaetaceae bacterium]
MAYYYTTASLPTLLLQQKTPFGRDFFLQLCESTLTPQDFQAVQNTTLGIPQDESLLEGVALEYWTWEKALRNALVKARAKEQNIDGTAFLRDEGMLGEVEDIASHALRQNNPLKAEQFLANQRWIYIDGLRRVDRCFGVENIQAWYLQYQILERMELFQKEEGFQRYKELYKEILEIHENSSENNEVNQ